MRSDTLSKFLIISDTKKVGKSLKNSHNKENKYLSLDCIYFLTRTEIQLDIHIRKCS